MFRPRAPRLRLPTSRPTLPNTTRLPHLRNLSTAPPSQKPRSLKSLTARLSLAGAVVYWYNSTDVFAEERRNVLADVPDAKEGDGEGELQTIEALAAQRRERRGVKAQLDAQTAEKASGANASDEMAGGVEQLEDEADQQGAFNPETGEINWDCPCLGGMAHGPCGEEFKSAFSCFVYSTDEPKGMDCIDKFKHMQNCFREYPEVYGNELEADAAAEKEEEEEYARTAATATGAAAETETDASPKSSRPVDVDVEPLAAASSSPSSSPASIASEASSRIARPKEKEGRVQPMPPPPEESPTNTEALSLVPQSYKPGGKEE